MQVFIEFSIYNVGGRVLILLIGLRLGLELGLGVRG